MSNSTPLSTPSDKVKKALIWLSEETENRPDASRLTLLREAEIRFDLCPAECTFLDKNFATEPDKQAP